MATAGSSYADFNVDPATGLKRRIMQSLPGGWGADPTAQDAPSGGGLPGGNTTAPFFVPPALGDPSAPTPKVGPGGIVQSSPTEGLPPAGSPAGAPVPGPVNYAMAGGASNAAGGFIDPTNTHAAAVPGMITSNSAPTLDVPPADQPPVDIPPPPPPAAPTAPDPNAPAAPAAAAHDPNNRNDQTYIDQTIADWMAKNNPQGHQDAAYWKRRILETGGLGPDNLAYWQGRFTEAPGTHQETPAAPAPAAGSPANDTYSKFLEQLMNDRNASAAQREQVRQMIMDRLKLAGQPVNENDIGITQPLSAARDEVQRSQQTERTALAERLYAQGSGGLNSNALTQGIQQSAERNAGGLSQLRAGLITSQIQQKQQEMQSLLQMALASGDTQSAQLLQAQIAALSAQVNREGLGVNLAEFLANLNKSTVAAGAGG